MTPKPGDEVYRRFTPGRRGYCTDARHTRGGHTYYQVGFPEGKEYVPDFELEIVTSDDSDPLDLVERGRFGRARDLRRSLTHIQLSGRLSSMIYSLDITNTDFLAYQFKPVLAFMKAPAHGLLIADEVGLGKTIEAGLIWTELRAREDYRQLLVVCPAMLCEKWQYELRNRFGIDATIMKSNELLNELRNDYDKIPDGKGVICSIQGIRPPSKKQQDKNPWGARAELAKFLREQAEQFDNQKIIDLTIIDEAHYMRTPGSQNARLGQLLRSVSEHILLLSATPINLRSDDLYNLLNIIDPNTFNSLKSFPQIMEANAPLVKAHQLIFDLKQNSTDISKCLEEAMEHSYWKNNLQLPDIMQKLADPKSIADMAGRVRLANRIEQVNRLHNVVNRTRKVEVLKERVMRDPKSHFVPLVADGDERKFYDAVTTAIRDYAQRHDINDGFLLASPQRQVSSCMYAAAKSWRDKTHRTDKISTEEMIYEDMGGEPDTYHDVSPLIEHLIREVLVHVDIQRLYDNDSKFEKFLSSIETYFQKFHDEKIVVFSYFRATLDYLHDRLEKHGIASIVLKGGMKENKQHIINRFRDEDEARVLLSSEVASEGVDLQFCRLLMNYDLPWNPMKIEQRIGRLDRIGQHAKRIIITNFGYADTIDQRIYTRLFERIDIFNRALGGLEEILGAKILELTGHILRNHLTHQEEEEMADKTALAIENIQKVEEQLEKDATILMAHSEFILKEVHKARDQQKRITENDLAIYVHDYLNLYATGHEFHRPHHDKLLFNIKLPAATIAKFDEYIGTHNLRGKTKLGTGGRVPCQFINKTVLASGRVEQISQFHPLVRFVSEEIRDKKLFPVVAVKLKYQVVDIKIDISDGQYAFAMDKWEFRGLRDEYDVRVRAVHIDTGHWLDAEDSWTLLNSARLNGMDWPEVTTLISPSLKDNILDCYGKLDEEFNVILKEKENKNTDSINFQIQSSKQNLHRALETLNNTLENFKERGETKMVPATEGRIEKRKTEFQVQIEKLKHRSNIKSDKNRFCCGVLFLEREG